MPNRESYMSDSLIVALDTDTDTQALDIARDLKSLVSTVKIGSALFTRYGPSLLTKLDQLGVEVFLDLKYHDIPSVVGKACGHAASFPCVKMLTVHALGDSSMISEARKALDSVEGPAPLLLAVTVLTSHEDSYLENLAVEPQFSTQDWAFRLAERALEAGADGLVCSAHEVQAFRSEFGNEVVLVTPGIRPAGMDHSDQKRVMTPNEALQAGSDYLVIGRPITEHRSPTEATLSILSEINFKNS